MNGRRYTDNGAVCYSLHGTRPGRAPERVDLKGYRRRGTTVYPLLTLRNRYLCMGAQSKCWECECIGVCEYGRMYMRRLREQEEKAGREWKGYEFAAAQAPKCKYQQW